MRPTLKGTDLTSEDQRHVLAYFINRYTKDHTPAWARHSSGARVQFASDQEWLERSHFIVTKKGRFDRRAKYCESYPTWPDGSRACTSTKGL